MEIFKKEILKQLKKALTLTEQQLSSLLETPPEPHLGDFAFPCFSLSKQFKQSPAQIAESILPKLSTNQYIEKIEQKQAYLNFFINKSTLATITIKEILKNKHYGKTKIKKQRILIEYPSPNTNKPLHLGHVRNILLGQSLSNLLKFQGHQVFQVSLNNDRGIHICKSMLAYKLYGNNKKPNKKSDHFVGDFYIKFAIEAANNPSLEQQAQDMLLKWENKDLETIKLWKLMNQWALKGFQETYKKFNLKFNKQYYESQIYQQATPLIHKALKQGIFEKDEKGNIIANLETYNLGKKVILRADGTSIYITQDIALAKLKEQQFHPNISIHIVASEQDYHFKVLFKVLSLLNFSTHNLYHLSYGMVYLPEGKMKSREGNVVDADNIIDELLSLSKETLEEKHPGLSKNELSKRSKIISMAALRFFILKFNPQQDFTYYPEQSLSFEGDTGPYILYTYARIQSILKKAKFPKKAYYSYLTEQSEKQLLTQLTQYPNIIQQASEKYRISLLCNYLIDLCKTFNSIYHELPILKSTKEIQAARLHLLKSTSIVISSSLSILGIETLNEM